MAKRVKSVFRRRSGTPQLHAVKQVDEAQSVRPEIEVTEKVEGSPSPNEGDTSSQDTSTIDFNSLIDACPRHPVIEAALASMQTLKVFVTQDGVVYHVEDPTRAFVILSSLLEPSTQGTRPRHRDSLSR